MMQSAALSLMMLLNLLRNGHTALRDASFHSTRRIYCRSGWGKRFRHRCLKR